MTTYTDPFAGSTVQISEVSYAALALTANAILSWPQDSFSAASPIFVRIMDCTPDAAGRTVTLPDARRVSAGYDTIFSNLGASSYSVLSASGVTLTTVASGQAVVLYLTSNATLGGTWRSFVLGAFTSSATSASLAGRGLAADGALLRFAPITATFSSTYSVTTADLAKTFAWTGGAGSATLPALAGLGSTFIVGFSNQGTGSLTVGITGTDTVDGMSSISLQPGESSLIYAGSLGWYTVGRGRSVQFNFSLLTKPITGGTSTLSAGEASNVVQKYTGVLTSNAIIVLPSVVQIYFVTNQTTGSFTTTFKTSGVGTTIALPQLQQAILLCDGTNIINANTSIAGISSLSLLQGSASAPSLSYVGNPTDGIFQPGSGSVAITLGGSQYVSFGTAALSIANTTITWSGSPTHSGIHTFSNNISCAVVPTLGAHYVNKTYADALAFLSVLPGQAGNRGKEITTNGTVASWGITAPGAMAIIHYMGL